MLSVESIASDLIKQNVQIFGICCDNPDSVNAWTVGLGRLSFPVLADFWPHGKICEAYGVLNQYGVPDRVMMLIDPEGRLCYLDNNHINEVPPTGPMLEICQKLGY